MSTAEDLLLITLDPESGKSRLSSTAAEPALGGAILFDLVAANRVALVGEKRKARVVATNAKPTGNPVLDAALARIQGKSLRPQTAVTRLGKKARDALYAALEDQRVLKARQDRVLLLFPVTRYELRQKARRESLLDRIRASLLRGAPVDQEIGPLIGLLSATDLVKAVVGKSDAKRAKAKAKEIAKGDWASEGVRKAIEATNAAVAAGVFAATAGAAASG
jgi:hypothetical protein